MNIDTTKTTQTTETAIDFIPCVMVSCFINHIVKLINNEQ